MEAEYDSISLSQLPPHEAPADRIYIVYKTYKYITMVFRDRTSEGHSEAFSIHQADARRLLEALRSAIETPANETFNTCVHGRAEGISRGGPPPKDSLVEMKDR